MTVAARLASAPLILASGIARRVQAPGPRLPRPAVSVGNLAMGGRAKTPLVAEIARLAIASGLRPAVLSRGYRGRVARRDIPLVLRAGGSGPSWLCHCHAWADASGDEPAWLAAVCPAGTQIGVHPDRALAASAVLSESEADLFVLDDGFQGRTPRDIDVVVLDEDLDPPFARRAILREGSRALGRADVVAVLLRPGPTTAPAPLASDWLPLRRAARDLLWLRDGSPADPAGLPPVLLAAGVGNPASAHRLASDLGLKVSGRVALRDHGRPGPIQRARLRRAGLVLVTEKDAMGWAAARPPSPRTVVLRQRIEGAKAVWDALARRLDLPVPSDPARQP